MNSLYISKKKFFFLQKIRLIVRIDEDITRLREKMQSEAYAKEVEFNSL